jgi:hypothetical protein
MPGSLTCGIRPICVEKYDGRGWPSAYICLQFVHSNARLSCLRKVGQGITHNQVRFAVEIKAIPNVHKDENIIVSSR